ncbi:MAG TPA: M55 family metallopeptidase [Anaerolineales bacterium]|nr:M55 family metallopeptidase [Anaerolineales bacterium]
MKILIAADMEGITGVTNWDQVTPGHFEYPRFRKLMTQDVNAAIEGAFIAGADDVLIADGHHLGSNILIEELDARAHLNSGSPAPLSMVNGVDRQTAGVLFIGYHAQAQSKHAILDHTWSSSRVAGVWLHEKRVGEIGLNAAVCGHFGAPVIMISGDQTACGEARDLLGPLEVAVVKHATGRMAAECLAPAVTAEKICEAAARAVGQLKVGAETGEKPRPYQVDAPVKLTIQFHMAEMADRAALLPGAERLDGVRIQIQAPDMLTAYAAFRAAVSLA